MGTGRALPWSAANTPPDLQARRVHPNITSAPARRAGLPSRLRQPRAHASRTGKLADEREARAA